MEAPVTTEVTCLTCSATIRIKSDLAGKRVKCPKCQAPVSVPSTTLDSDEHTSTTPRWLFVGAAALISLAVGVAGGYVFRHRQDKSDDKRELAEALALSKSLTDKLKVTESNLAGSQANLEKLKLELADTARDTEAKLADLKQREVAAITKARETDDKLQARIAAAKEAEALARRREVEESTRRREEEARQAEASKKLQASREKPTRILFKDFANFPEEYAGRYVRFDAVWIGGDFDRVKDTNDFSPSVSSQDGKHIFGSKYLDYGDGVMFIISEKIGRPLSVAFKNDTKYKVNLCCEVTKSSKRCLARIYRIETLTVGGDVKDVFEDK
jgi:hypothetical protein